MDGTSRASGGVTGFAGPSDCPEQLRRLGSEFLTCPFRPPAGVAPRHTRTYVEMTPPPDLDAHKDRHPRHYVHLRPRS